MDSKEDSRRKHLEELAKKLNTQEGLTLARQLQAAGLLGGDAFRDAPQIRQGHEPEGRRRISIWEPIVQEGGLVFRRPEPGPFDDHYAKTPEFPAEKPPGCKRVVFLGESVAAGYLLAPHVTPALMLQSFINQCWPDQAIEVVDLSRTNETLAGMIQLVKESVQLQPDLVIFFAGNNWTLMEMPEWSPFLPSVPIRQRLGELWSEGGMGAVKQDELRRLSQSVGRKLKSLGDWLSQQGLPAIWILPEVNLKDWDHSQPPPFLGREIQKDWHQSLRAALEAWEREEWPEVQKLAWHLLDLDDGTCPVGYRLLGLTLMMQGKNHLAREAFRYEVQASGYSGSCFLGAPQVTPHLTKLIFHFTSRYEISLVRLDEAFPGELPGRDGFYDYCHLTSKGMRLSMSAVLTPLQNSLGLGDAAVDPGLLQFEIPARVEAVACLGAAIHSCHRQVPVVENQTPWRYWLEQAVTHDSTIVELFKLYIQARSGLAPLVFSPAQAAMLEEHVRITPQHGWFYEYLDAPILATMLQVLQERAPQEYAASLEYMLKHRGISDHPVSLTADGFYLWEPLARYIPDVLAHSRMSQSAILRCPWPQIAFALVVDSGKNLQLDLTLRLPEGVVSFSGEPTVLLVNQQRVQEWVLSPSWSDYQAMVPWTLLTPGINKLELNFPVDLDPEWHGKAKQRFLLGKEASFHPVYGEIWDISVRVL